MQQQERMQTRGIQANFISQQMAAANRFAMQERDMQFRAHQGAENRAFQAEQQDGINQMRRQLADLDQENRLDVLRQQQVNRKEILELQAKNEQEQDVINHLAGAARDTRSMVDQALQAGFEFSSEEESARYRKNLSDLDRIAEDETLSPIQKAQAQFKITSRLPIPSIKKQDFGEEIESKIHWFKDKNTGRELPITYDRSGSPQIIGGYKPDDAVVEPEAEMPDAPSLADQYRTDPKAFTSMFKTFYDALTTETPGSEGSPATKKYPTPDEVMAAIEKAMQRMDGGGGNENVPPRQPPSSPNDIGKHGIPKERMGITDDEAFEGYYEFLPSGSNYVAPDGTLRTKP